MGRLCHDDQSLQFTVEPCLADFSLEFQNIVLHIIPASLFIPFALYRVARLRKYKPCRQNGSTLGLTKTITAILTSLVDLAFLCTLCQLEKSRDSVFIAAASLRLAVSVLVIFLSWLEHCRSVRPSLLLQVYLVFTIPLDTITLRALRIRLFLHSTITLSAAHLILRFLLLALESLDKTSPPRDGKPETLQNEETAGLFGERLMLWLLPLFRRGYRQKLQIDELIPLDSDLKSHKAWNRFEKNGSWHRPFLSKYSLLLTLGSIIKREVVIAIIPQVLMIVTSVAKPFLVMVLLRYVATDPEVAGDMQGYGIIAAFALTYSMASISQSWSTQCMNRIQTHARDFLTTAIYNKTLALKSTAADEDSPVSLMNVDVERFLFGIMKLHDLWGGFVITLIGLYLLYVQVGWAFLAPLVVIGISTVVSGQVGKGVAPRQLAWSETTNARVDYITDMLSSMKTIKMLGLPDIVEKAVTQLRIREIDAQKHIRRIMLWIWTCVIAMFPISTLATFVAYGLLPRPQGERLDTQRAFAALAILKFFTQPMLMVLQFWTIFISGLACIERIQRFLERNDFEDRRTLGISAPENSNNDAKSATNSDSGGAAISSRQSITVKSATFGYNAEGAILQDLTLDFKKGQLTMIIGRVGSGKSTLLHSLLGETQMAEGSLYLPTPKVAFCAQTPWLQNKTIRDNIIGISKYDEGWYHRVVSCCALEEDIAELANGDATNVGSKGVALSGGQKNRLSLARAVYSRRPTLLLDDILSGLDRRTEHSVFTQLLGKHGLLRDANTTIVLVTHSKRYLQDADKIVILDAGRVAGQGTFKELAATGALDQISEMSDDKGDSASTTPVEKTSPSASAEGLKKPAIKSSEEKKSSSDEADTPENTVATYTFFFRGFGTIGLAIFLVVVAMSQTLKALQAVWLKQWSSAENPNQLKYYLGFSGISLSTVFSVVIIFRYYFLVSLPRLSMFMHTKQLDALIHATLSFLTATESGKILNRFSQDITMVDGNIPMCFLNVVSLTFDVICSTILILVATPHIAITLPFIIISGYSIQRVFLRTSKQMRILDIEAKAPLVSHLTETYSGLTTIRAYGWIDSFGSQNFEFLEEAQIPFYLMASIQNWLSLVLDLLITGLATLVSVVAVVLRSKIDPGYLGLALIGVMDIGLGFRFMLQNWVFLDTSLGAIVRIKAFADETPQERREDSRDPPQDWPSAGLVEFKGLTASYAPSGEIVLKDLDVTIPAGSEIGIVGRSGSGKTSTIGTLSGLLHIQSGSVTIDGMPLDVIPLSALRSQITVLPQDPFFLPHRKGGNTVRSNLWPWAELDNLADSDQDAKEIDYRTLSIVQSAHEDSVHPTSIPADSAMVSALEKVGLWKKFTDQAGSTASVVASQSSQSPATAAGSESALLNADVSERTPLMNDHHSTTESLTPGKILSQTLDLREFLSHGERQLFCLARALLTKNKILVLDEATSSVDTQTESLMLEIIATHFRGWTKIAIAHRLDTILSADQVVVLGGGRVLEKGDPRELMKKDGGLLRGMVEGGD